MMTFVPDTSIVIDGQLTTYIENTDSNDITILIPEFVIGELEAQANNGQQTGIDGLQHLEHLANKAATDDTLTIDYVGDTATNTEIAHAPTGSIDALIRGIAEEHNATLLTSDDIQHRTCKAKHIPTEYIRPKQRSTDNTRTLGIEDYFDDNTLSVHLKTDTQPKAKQGDITDIQYTTIREDTLSELEIRELADEIETSSAHSPHSYTELTEPGMTIVQHDNYRIAVSRPPFSEAIEITAVRPIVKTALEDYEFDDEFKTRFLEKQRGVLISGAPGAGKSTFAQAVAEFLNENQYAVKTMENPRDLQVGNEITQYTALNNEMEKTADSLLLVRPDYTVYDEVRKTNDFEVFSDMRLAGVGMVGVVHATRAIDALQRLVGRVELGLIPQIVDTVAHIEDGDIETLYDVQTRVKVPEGMDAEDLVRPVVQVINFETGEEEYEIYTFNGQVVTSPLEDIDDTSDSQPEGVYKIAAEKIKMEIKRLAYGSVDVDVTDETSATVYVEKQDMSDVIGSNGATITELENTLGMNIDVRSWSEKPSQNAAEQREDLDGDTDGITVSREHDEIVFTFDNYSEGDVLGVHCGGTYFVTATVNENDEIRVSENNGFVTELEENLLNGSQVHVTPVKN